MRVKAARKVNYQVRMVTLDGTELWPRIICRWCQPFPKYGLCQTELDVWSGNASSGCSFEKAEQEVETKDNLLKQAQRIPGLYSKPGWASASGATASPIGLPTKPRATERNSELLEALKSGISNRCDPVSPRRAGVLTEQLAKLSFKRKSESRHWNHEVG